ncbi:MAG: HAD family hydrolase [Sporichthyaceae bacterium]
MTAPKVTAPQLTPRPIVAVDLDRTLIYSAAALGLPVGPSLQTPPRLVVAEIYEGRPISFLTTRAVGLLEELRAVAEFVPCTTRTIAQYERVQLVEGVPSYAITTNGGRILLEGRECPDWTASVAATVAAGSAPLPEIAEHLAKIADPLWIRANKVAEDLFCYLLVNRDELPPAFVSDLTEWCAAAGWEVSLQGRKLYVVPRALTKGAAAAEIVRRTGAKALFAAGDALLDAPLLEAADLGVRPAHGELHDLGWTRPHVAVTGQAGVFAGEEILTALLAACD